MTLGTWVVLGMVAGRPRPGDDRRQRLLNPVASRGAAEASLAKRQLMFQAKVTAAAHKLGQSLRPSDEAALGKIRLKLLNAGFHQEQAVAVFYGVKVIGMLIGVAVAFPPLAMKYGMTQKALTYTATAAGLGFYLADFLVGRRQKKR